MRLARRRPDRDPGCVPGKLGTPTLRGCTTGFCSLILTLLTAVAGEALEPSVFGGAEFDNHGQGFAYLGGNLEEKLHPNFSLLGRLMPNFLTYKFRSEGEEVKATSPGVFGLVGVKGRWGQTSASVLAGAEVRDTQLSPDVSDARVRGTTAAPLVHADFDTWLPSHTNLNYFGSFSAIDGFIYQRGTVKQQLTNLDYSRPHTVNAGVEFVYGTNPDFEMYRTGVVVEVFSIPRTLSLQVRGGYAHDTTFGSGFYGGLSFYKGF